MKTRTIRTAVLTLVLSVSATILAGEPVDSKKVIAPPEPENPWQFKLAVPAWLAATAGTIGVDGVNSKVYLGADTLIQHLDMIATLSAEARYRRLGIYGDFLYVSASDGVGVDGLLSKVDVRLDQYLVDLELNYRVLEGPQGFLDVRAGVRYTNIYNRITLHPDNDAIDNASTQLVNDLANQLRQRLSDLDLANLARAAIKDRLTDRLRPTLRPERRNFAVAPLGGNLPNKFDALIMRKFDKRKAELAAAVRAEAEAATDALRAAAQQRIVALKSRLSKEIAQALKSDLNQVVSLTEYWFDPYVGIRARYNMTKAFYVTAKADIGGFGVGSDLTWQASGAFGCQITRHIYTELGYRYLYTDYNHDGFVYDVAQSGVEWTTGISF